MRHIWDFEKKKKEYNTEYEKRKQNGVGGEAWITKKVELWGGTDILGRII